MDTFESLTNRQRLARAFYAVAIVTVLIGDIFALTVWLFLVGVL